jgi:CheY-like chemotaxis protein
MERARERRAMANIELSGQRVLVIEDEWAIRMMIEDALAELGCAVAGTAVRVDEALAKAGSAGIDLAVVDVNLDGGSSYEVADALNARGIPFVFATGYGSAGLRADYPGVPVLNKPFEPRELERALMKALQHRCSKKLQ